MTKLKFYYITGKAYTLIKSYLENRHQRITSNYKCFNFCSSWGVINHGVPQASTLGPLLLLFYINPFNTQLNPICHLLALFGALHILHVSRKELIVCQKLQTI
jgi:hypothetical protein